MYKFYLNDTEVEEPEGFNGASFTKGRHETFFGFWGGFSVSDTEQNARLKFTEERAVNIIKKEYKRNFIKSTLTFKFVDCSDNSACNSLTYLVDFADYIGDCCEVEVTFRANYGDTIRSRTGVKYALLPNTDVTIPTKSLEGGTDFEINDTLSVVNGTGLISHNVPLTGITSVTANEYNYVNGGTAKAIDLVGVIQWSASADVPTNYKVAVFVYDANGVEVEKLSDVATYTTDLNDIQTKSLSVINYIMQPYYKLAVRAYSTVSTVTHQFLWQPSSSTTEGVIIRDHNEETPFSTHKGILLKDAFEQLIDKMSNGTMKLCSKWLDSCNDKWITNGYGLKGVVRPINISLEEMFNGLNPIDNIEIGIDGDCVNVERKGQNGKGKSNIRGDYEVFEKTNTDWLFSSVTGGYKEWQSDTNFENDEVNSERNYSTDYVSGKSDLDLQSDFIASHYLIEKVKRQTGKADADTKYDESIFIVCVVKDGSSYKAETDENFTTLGGVIYPKNTINLRISPARNLKRHRNYLYLSGDTIFESGTGNYSAYQRQNYTCNDENYLLTESITFNEIPKQKIFGQTVAVITKTTTLSEYCRLKENITFELCGVTKTGLLKNADLNIDDGVCTMVLEVYI